MFKHKFLLIWLYMIVTCACSAPITLPTTDFKGGKDNELLKRYEGSIIIDFESQGFSEFTFPLSALSKKSTGKKFNNFFDYLEPVDKKIAEGPYTRLTYLIPPNRSPLEVIRNYQDDIRDKGGKVLFECKSSECGGNGGKASREGGGDMIMSLSDYIYPLQRLANINGLRKCIYETYIDDQRYMVAELGSSQALASLLTYVVQSQPESSCASLNGRTIVRLDIIESKARQSKMVAIAASEITSAITNGGKIALYGIQFDSNKSEIKPESAPTLEEMAKALKNNPSLKVLIVGHTDNVGGYSFNMDLSQRRANSVVSSLVSKYGVGKDKLYAAGVSFASPIASNATEEGRLKNRRVEMVDNSSQSK